MFEDQRRAIAHQVLLAQFPELLELSGHQELSTSDGAPHPAQNSKHRNTRLRRGRRSRCKTATSQFASPAIDRGPKHCDVSLFLCCEFGETPDERRTILREVVPLLVHLHLPTPALHALALGLQQLEEPSAVSLTHRPLRRLPHTRDVASATGSSAPFCQQTHRLCLFRRKVTFGVRAEARSPLSSSSPLKWAFPLPTTRACKFFTHVRHHIGDTSRYGRHCSHRYLKSDRTFSLLLLFFSAGSLSFFFFPSVLLCLFCHSILTTGSLLFVEGMWVRTCPQMSVSLR